MIFVFLSTLLTFHRCLVSCGCLFLLAYLAVMFMISLNVVNYLAFTKTVFFKHAHQIYRSRMTQKPIILSPIALSFLINASIWILSKKAIPFLRSLGDSNNRKTLDYDVYAQKYIDM